MDVVYSGLHRTPEEVVNTAIQEDVDVLGVSLLSGVQLTVFPKLFRLLEERGANDIIVIAGGVMPAEDVDAIKKMGVREVLLQDTPPQAIVATLTRLVAGGNADPADAPASVPPAESRRNVDADGTVVLSGRV